MTASPNELKPGDALIIVDVQNDFCPGGALPIERGDEVVPVLNDWIAAAVAGEVAIYASRDYHPQGHMSFDESGGPWPLHCIQDSDGARFHPDLNLPADATVVTKGVRLDQDQNSAFDQTGLATELRKQEVNRVIRRWSRRRRVRAGYRARRPTRRLRGRPNRRRHPPGHRRGRRVRPSADARSRSPPQSLEG